MGFKKLPEDSLANTDDRFAFSGSSFSVFEDRDLSMWSQRCATKQKAIVHPAVEDFFWNMKQVRSDFDVALNADKLLEPKQDRDWGIKKKSSAVRRYWKCHTECTINTNDVKTLIRCHPNYQSEGKAYYDWVSLDYNDQLFPAKVMAFVETGDEKDPVMALVHSCNADTISMPNDRDSPTMSSWFTEYEPAEYRRTSAGKLITKTGIDGKPEKQPTGIRGKAIPYKPILRLVSISSIAQRCFVTDPHRTLSTRVNVKVSSTLNGRLQYNDAATNNDINTVVLMKKRGLWTDRFTNPLRYEGGRSLTF